MNRLMLNIIALALLASVIHSCSDSSIEFSEDDVPNGRRDYIWTIDTLPYRTAQLNTALFGFSQSNIWAARGNIIYHHDGIRWEESFICETPINAIFGLSPDDVWAVGLNIFYHFDGIQWQEFSRFSVSEYAQWNYGLFGLRPNEIFCTGERFKNASQNIDSTEGVIMKFDGVKWSHLQTTYSKNVLFFQIFYDRINKKYYMGGRVLDIQRHLSWIDLFEFDGISDIKKVNDGRQNALFLVHRSINGKAYFFSLNNKELFFYRNRRFLKYKDFSTSNLSSVIGARTEKDLFGFSEESDRKLLHYDGNNLVSLHDISGLPVEQWIGEKEIFILQIIPEGTVILKGVLTEQK